MGTDECTDGWLGKFRHLLTTVLLPGLWQTPARWHKNWFTYFYFLPALPGCFAFWLYPTAITQLPTLEQATAYEGTASIWKHPSQGIGTVVLKLATDERISFRCRSGARLDPACVAGDVLTNRKKYSDKPARVWGAPVTKGFGSPGHVAIQIEIDGEIVRSYEWSVKQLNSGWLDSNESIITIAHIFAVYILGVLIGFPYLNYRHWKKEH